MKKLTGRAFLAKFTNSSLEEDKDIKCTCVGFLKFQLLIIADRTERTCNKNLKIRKCTSSFFFLEIECLKNNN